MAAEPLGRRRWLRLASVRVRTTLAATLIVALGLAAGAVALSVVQERALTSRVDDALRVRAQDVATLLEDGNLPPVLGVRDREEALVQVVGPGGEIVSASANVAGQPLLVGDLGDGGSELRTLDGLPIDDEPFRALARRVDLTGGSYTIYVAEALDDVRDGQAVLNRSLAVAVPLLTLLVGGLTWIVVGRALAPVEAIRLEVAEIGGDELHRRVPEPRLDDEIGRLARTMNAMLERVEDAHERQRRFVADASHELRTPLTGMRAQLEVDLASTDGAGREQTERAVLEETVRLQRLVEDLLALARDEGDREPSREAVDLDDVVFREVESARAVAGEVEIDSSGVSGAQLRGDAGQLARVVRNLLDNAVRHANSRVIVALVEDGPTLTLTVDDDGTGIPEDQRGQVFERFARLDEARTRREGGAGLGLAITHEIVERHGGTIAVDASDYGGARFVVRLPAAR